MLNILKSSLSQISIHLLAFPPVVSLLINLIKSQVVLVISTNSGSQKYIASLTAKEIIVLSIIQSFLQAILMSIGSSIFTPRLNIQLLVLISNLSYWLKSIEKLSNANMGLQYPGIYESKIIKASALGDTTLALMTIC